jgi:hypothetical protein
MMSGGGLTVEQLLEEVGAHVHDDLKVCLRVCATALRLEEQARQ